MQSSYITRSIKTKNIPPVFQSVPRRVHSKEFTQIYDNMGGNIYSNEFCIFPNTISIKSHIRQLHSDIVSPYTNNVFT